MSAKFKATSSKQKEEGKNLAKKKKIAVELPKAKKEAPGASKTAAAKNEGGKAGKNMSKAKKNTVKPLLPDNITIENKENVVPEYPINYLVSLYGEEIQVHLKFNNAMYKGKLESIDEYFNLRLKNTIEYISGKETGEIGDCFIRCNTVLFINQKTK